jgi:protein TonB
MKTTILLKRIFAVAIICAAFQTASYAQNATTQPDEFIPVEKPPIVDLQKLAKSVIYPDLAKRGGIEGKVIIKVLIGKDGLPQKTILDHSDNRIFDTAAITAVMAATYTPAIAEGKPIACWVSIPVTFKLNTAPSIFNTNTTDPKKETPVTEPE